MEWKETILSQYSRSYKDAGGNIQLNVIQKLVSGLADLLDPAPDIKLFYEKAFDPATCEGKGIEVWKRIVAMVDVSNVTVTSDNWFGYDRSETGLTSFDDKPFWYLSQDSTKYTFVDASLRTMIMAKAWANICNASLGAIAKLITMILGTTQFAIHNNPSGEAMTIKLTAYGVKPVALELLKLYLPKVVGGGVKVNYEATKSSIFGFKGAAYAATFGRGLFYNSAANQYEYTGVI